MPGLPMVGHGQIEGFEEKYGMEYRKAYKDEKPDQGLVERHEREIFPLMRKRYLFSGSANFVLYDFRTGASGHEGNTNENVFAYSNRVGDEKALILYNTAYSTTSGFIQHAACDVPVKGTSDKRHETLVSGLGLHGSDPWYVLMKELRSGLWFIRSSKELNEKGLFAELSGYGCQVFVEIKEVSDDEVPSTDSGTGRRNFPHVWSKLNYELKGRGVPSLEDAAENLFYGDLYYRFNQVLGKEANKKDENVVQKFLERMAALMKEEGLPYSEPKAPKEIVIINPYLALTLLRQITDEPASVARHFGLDRKLREAGSTPDEVNAMFFALTGKTARTPYTFILDNYENEDFRALIGVNVFDDVTWFNKEKFEAALKNLPLYLPDVKKFVPSLTAAEEASGYRLDALLKALEPAPSEPRPAARAEKKAPAKKPAAKKPAPKAAPAKSSAKKAKSK
jgi:hypothetical protein